VGKIENEIFKVQQFGVMSVYERKVYQPHHKYFVLDERTGHILEDFARRQSACSWASVHREG
jgi:hypothetical protein